MIAFIIIKHVQYEHVHELLHLAINEACKTIAVHVICKGMSR